jgi:hypothetical protein
MAYGKKSIKALEVGDILTAKKAFTNVNVPSATYTSGQILGKCTKLESGRVYYVSDGVERFLFDTSISTGTVGYSANPQYDYPAVAANPAGNFIERNSSIISSVGSLLLGWFSGKATATLNDGSGGTATLDSNGNYTPKTAEEIEADKQAAIEATAAKKKKTTTTIVVIAVAVAAVGAVIYFVSKGKKTKTVAAAVPPVVAPKKP